MKSIFKKIALVLALAMVVTMLPAKSAAVSAADASANKWVRKTCTLYIDALEDDTIYVPAAYATAKPKVAVAKDAEDGWGTLGYSVSFASADENVAVVGERYGLVEAVGIGQTTITATFTKEGAATVTESFPVTVKRAAASVALDEETEKAVNSLVVGNDPVVLKAVMTDADGNQELVEKTTAPGKLSVLLAEGRKYVTDYLKFEVKNPEDKEVLKYDAEKNELTAVAEGTATLNVVAYRYDWKATAKTKTKYAKTRTAVQPYTVTVKAAGILDAKQTTHNTVAINCETEELAKAIADKPAENLKVAYELNQGEIAERINYASVDGTDKKVVNVTLYNDLKKDTVYNFTYKDSKVSVKGADVSLENVADIDIKTPFAKVQTWQPIIVYLLNPEGIVIAEVDSVRADLRFEADPNADYSLSNNEIYFFEVGKQATITVTFDKGYDLNTGNKKNDIVKKHIITSRSEDANYGSVIAWGIDAASDKKGSDIAKSTDTLRLAVGDSKQLYIRIDETQFNGKVEGKYFPTNDSGQALAVGAYIFESSNPDVLLVDSASAKITAVNSGYAQILVRKQDYASNPVVGLIGVQVSNARQMNTVALKEQSRTLSAVNGQKATIKFEVKDQLGDPMDASGNVTFEGVHEGLTCTASYEGWSNLVVVTVEVTDATKFSTNATNVDLRITIGDPTAPWRTQTRAIRLVVKQPGDITRYAIGGNINQKDLNLVWTNSSLGDYAGTFTLQGLDSQGYYKEDLILKSSIESCNEGDYYVEVRRNNTLLTIADGTNVAMDGNGVKISLVTVSGSAVTSGSAITVTKISNGTGIYIVQAYKVTGTGNNKKGTPVATTQFNVVDNTPAVVAARNKNTLSKNDFGSYVNQPVNKEAMATSLQISEAFNVLRWGGKVANLTFISADYSITDTYLHVSKITVKEFGPYDKFGTGAELTYDISVNMTFTLN